MASFATPAELASWLQVPEVDTATATLQLAAASKAIRDFCGWNITAETVTDEMLDTDGERSLWLPTLWLTDVASINELTLPLTAGTDYEWRRYGKVTRLDRRCWPRQSRSVEITYTHGYPEIPDSIKGICLSLAGRVYNNPVGARSQTAGPFAQSFAVPSSGAVASLLLEELSQLGPYKLEFVG